MQDADHKVLAAAAEFTASQVANQWFALSVNSYSDSNQASDHIPNSSKPNCTRDFKVLHAQETPQESLLELDSSFLAPYLETTELENNQAFPPTGTGNNVIQSFSKEYFCQFFAALELDAPSYAHMPRSIIEFKSLFHKYQHVFHLPNSPLSTIKGFSNTIPTGDSPPVYRLTYCKSPVELAAIKTEIEHMLKLNVIHPSHSAWGPLTFWCASC